MSIDQAPSESQQVDAAPAAPAAPAVRSRPYPSIVGFVPTSVMKEGNDRLLHNLDLFQALREERWARQKAFEGERVRREKQRDCRRRRQWSAGVYHLPNELDLDVLDSEEEYAFETIDLQTGERTLCSSNTMAVRLRESTQRLLAAAGDLGLDGPRSRSSNDGTEAEGNPLVGTVPVLTSPSTVALPVNRHSA